MLPAVERNLDSVHNDGGGTKEVMLCSKPPDQAIADSRTQTSVLLSTQVQTSFHKSHMAPFGAVRLAPVVLSSV